MTTTHICICGGGSLAHVCAGVLASRPDTQVNILTRHPQDWAERITVTDPDGRIYEGAPATVSADAREALQGCTLVLLCLPGFAIRETLERIRPHIGPAVAVGSIVSSTGFFFAAHSVLDADTPLFGFQRVPYIARTGEYGRSALLLGYKPELAVAIEHTPDAEALRALLEKLWSTPTRLLGSHYEASLTNSNPILHTGRLYTLWSQWHGEVSERPILFYREWTDDASRLLLDMDAEFMQLLQVLPVGKHAIPSLLDYYECSDAESLTRNLQPHSRPDETGGRRMGARLCQPILHRGFSLRSAPHRRHSPASPRRNTHPEPRLRLGDENDPRSREDPCLQG